MTFNELWDIAKKPELVSTIKDIQPLDNPAIAGFSSKWIAVNMRLANRIYVSQGINGNYLIDFLSIYGDEDIKPILFDRSKVGNGLYFYATAKSKEFERYYNMHYMLC